jgi:RNA polymerase sigma factor (sigma-70 family)
MESAPEPGEVERLLAGARAELLAFVRRRASPSVLRMESAEDLVQDVCARVVERGIEGVFPDERARRAWLLRVADNFLKDRRDHWSALKRDGSRVLRMSLAGEATREDAAVRELASSITGPSTFAVRREQVSIAALALDMLLPRDRELIEGLCQGLDLREQAARLGLGHEATQRARQRALERLRRTFRLALQARG